MVKSTKPRRERLVDRIERLLKRSARFGDWKNAAEFTSRLTTLMRDFVSGRVSAVEVVITCQLAALILRSIDVERKLAALTAEKAHAEPR